MRFLVRKNLKIFYLPLFGRRLSGHMLYLRQNKRLRGVLLSLVLLLKVVPPPNDVEE